MSGPLSSIGRVLGNRLTLSVIGLVVTLALCVTYLFAAVLEVPLTHRPDEVTVHLTRTGGLYEGSPVTYRGVRVGTVESIGIDGDGRAEAVITLRDGTRVPRATRAAVRSLSPVGEQFLDLQPATADGPFLADGDEIDADAVDLPVSIAEAADGLDRLLGEVEPRDVRTVLKELSLAMDGSGDDLARLLDSTDELSRTLDEAYPETARLLRHGETVGELLARSSGRLTRFSASARKLTAFLKDYDPEFRRILHRAPRDFDTVDGFVGDLRSMLPPLLDVLYRTTDLLWEREPHLRALTQALPFGTGRFGDAFRDGWLRVDVLLQGQPKCEYGSTEREPTADRGPLNPDGHCAQDSHVWRGAQHAPPPLDR